MRLRAVRLRRRLRLRRLGEQQHLLLSHPPQLALVPLESAMQLGEPSVEELALRRRDLRLGAQ